MTFAAHVAYALGLSVEKMGQHLRLVGYPLSDGDGLPDDATATVKAVGALNLMRTYAGDVGAVDAVRAILQCVHPARMQTVSVVNRCLLGVVDVDGTIVAVNFVTHELLPESDPRLQQLRPVEAHSVDLQRLADAVISDFLATSAPPAAAGAAAPEPAGSASPQGLAAAADDSAGQPARA